MARHPGPASAPPRPPQLAPIQALPGRLCPPGEPTKALPGSEEKIVVMIDRAGRREALFHRRDTAEPMTMPHALAQGSGPARVQDRVLPRGVSYYAARGRYQARAIVGGARVYLGLFVLASEAGAAVERAEG
jgi:hypothetical protein